MAPRICFSVIRFHPLLALLALAWAVLPLRVR